VAVLEARDALYQEAKAKHPARWSGPTRNWEKTHVVWLNQERQKDKDL
jgi:putative transposase